MIENLKIPGDSGDDSDTRKNLRFGLAFLGFVPLPVILFAWLAVVLERYMNTVGSFTLLASMMALAWASFASPIRIRRLSVLAAIALGQYVALYFLIYQKL